MAGKDFVEALAAAVSATPQDVPQEVAALVGAVCALRRLGLKPQAIMQFAVAAAVIDAPAPAPNPAHPTLVPFPISESLHRAARRS